MGEYLGALAAIENDVGNDVDNDYARLMRRFAEMAHAAGRSGMGREDGMGELLRLIFRPFPCFAELVAPTGVGMPACVSSFYTSEAFAEYNLRFEQMVASGQANIAPVAPTTFSTIFPNYRPEINLILAPEHTVMRVTERRADGSPINNVSYYAWPGGYGYYDQRPAAMDALVDLISAPRDISFGRNVGGPGRRARLAPAPLALGNEQPGRDPAP